MKRERGEGRIFLRGKIWWVQYGHRGRDHRESSKSPERKVALRLLKKRLAEVHSGRHAPAAEKVTLADLRQLLEADHRLNGRRATVQPARAWFHLEEYFDPTARAVDITAARLSAYAAARAKDGAASATFVYELAVLRRGFTLALRDALLQSRPTFPSIRFNNVRTGWASDADVAAIIKELPEPLRAPIRFAYITGWRLHSEVLSLTWANVTAEAIRLEVGSTKSGAAREWPLRAHPALAALIAAQRGYTDAVQKRQGAIVPWVFHRDGQQIRSLSAAWKGAAKRAGLKLIPHDLRRSAARNLERAGVPRSIIMRRRGSRPSLPRSGKTGRGRGRRRAGSR